MSAPVTNPPVPPTAGRRWWRVLGTIVAILVVAMTALQVLSLIARSNETVRSEHDVDGIERLEVLSVNGDVEVTAVDRDDVLVVAEVSHGLRRTRTEVERRDGALVVTAECPVLVGRCWVDYRIEVPPDLHVHVESDNGRVTARGIGGTARLSSDNGTVEAIGLRGRAVLSSSNGHVRTEALASRAVEASSDNGDVAVDLRIVPDHVLAESDNGDVVVRVPRSEDSYDLDLDTDNGERFGEVRTDPDSERRLVVRSANGDVTVGYRLT